MEVKGVDVWRGWGGRGMCVEVMGVGVAGVGMWRGWGGGGRDMCVESGGGEGGRVVVREVGTLSQNAALAESP